MGFWVYKTNRLREKRDFFTVLSFHNNKYVIPLTYKSKIAEQYEDKKRFPEEVKENGFPAIPVIGLVADGSARIFPSVEGGV